MIYTLLFFYLIIGLTCCSFVSTFNSKLFILFIIAICHLLLVLYIKLIYQRNNHFIKIKDISQLYNSFQHGDVVFTMERDIWVIFDLLAINNGICHTGIVIKENGIKYLVHSFPGISNHKKYVIRTYTWAFQTWTVIKEPLLNYILSYRKSLYQIFKQPHSLPKIIFNNEMCNNVDRYCTQLVGIILEKNNIIDRYINYRPYSLINYITQLGYKCCFIKHI